MREGHHFPVGFVITAGAIVIVGAVLTNAIINGITTHMQKGAAK